jgi:hypothetical protein
LQQLRALIGWNDGVLCGDAGIARCFLPMGNLSFRVGYDQSKSIN